MFTGIIEETGTVVALRKNKSNLDISVKSSFIKEIKIDQSIAHNGVCLTVCSADLQSAKKNSLTVCSADLQSAKKNSPIKNRCYTVTAISETLSKTNLKFLKVGDKINLERCMKADGRFDGHIVQGHVDCTAKVHSIEEKNGSWLFKFEVRSTKPEVKNLIVEKGSICVNGVSLTVVDCLLPTADCQLFSTAIIPYTYKHTNFHTLKIGDFVNIEFDIIGKYVAKILQGR